MKSEVQEIKVTVHISKAPLYLVYAVDANRNTYTLINGEFVELTIKAESNFEEHHQFVGDDTLIKSYTGNYVSGSSKQ